MATQQIEQIDTVTLSVINNAFVNVCREMGTAMMRTSYSPIFNEGLDFSCMMFNTRGDLIGQAEFCPTMLGSCQYAMKWMLDEVGLDAFEPGDVFIHNDPYRGQCHMPEHLVVKAVFWDGRPWGFVGEHRPRRRDRRHGARILRRRRNRSLPGRPAPAADQDHGAWRVRQGSSGGSSSPITAPQRRAGGITTR